jgi:hypothetical protein
MNEYFWQGEASPLAGLGEVALPFYIIVIFASSDNTNA